jgi:hypothetical protein
MRQNWKKKESYNYARINFLFLSLFIHPNSGKVLKYPYCSEKYIKSKKSFSCVPHPARAIKFRKFSKLTEKLFERSVPNKSSFIFLLKAL